jgi:lysyl-tRNA synthetase class 2
MADSHDSGSGQDALVAARGTKAAKVRADGRNPFANDLDASARSTIGQIRARFAPALTDAAALRYDSERVAELAEGQPFHVVGRLMARRGFGKLIFLVLRDGSGELQLLLHKEELGSAADLLDELDVADHLEARGTMMVTKKGELSLEARSFRLLTKALRPLPDKWHGLADVDLRYRRRYVDLVANPEVAAVFRARSIIVQALRSFLDGEEFVEVETPTLHSLVGGAAARPFVTHHNALDLELFLRIAPELYLKRLLVGGFERVYEIGRCYRNEGISTRHNPEFTMLEFYQAYATYETLMPLTERLFRHVDRSLAERLEAAGLGATYEAWRASRPFTLDEPFARVQMRAAVEAALDKAGIAASELVPRLAEIAITKKDERREAPEIDDFIAGLRNRSERARGIDFRNLRAALGGCESDGERLFAAYEYLAEPFLADDYRSVDGSRSVPVFIVDYPAEVSPLARRKDTDASTVDRFELFVHGRELCNAFSELNDPEDQAERFRGQMAKKARGAEETMDYDEDYVLALEHGMPPAAGFGLGVDRLVMALTNQPSIRDVIPFPLLRPESSDR